MEPDPERKRRASEDGRKCDWKLYLGGDLEAAPLARVRHELAAALASL